MIFNLFCYSFFPTTDKEVKGGVDDDDGVELIVEIGIPEEDEVGEGEEDEEEESCEEDELEVLPTKNNVKY